MLISDIHCKKFTSGAPIYHEIQIKVEDPEKSTRVNADTVAI